MGEREEEAGKKKKKENILVLFLHGVIVRESLILLYSIKQFIL